MTNKTIDQHKANGVEFVSFENTYIEPTVKIGKNVKIYPNVVLTGNTTIGNNTIIWPFTFIHDSKIVGNAEIGPFARIRDGAVIEADVKIGNFVEVKNSHINSKSKAMHLAYIGDAEIGEGVNIGAGMITANFDGKNKHKTKIGDGTFVGSNTTLIAPLTIGKNAKIAAGSTITIDVKDGEIAFARERQINKK